MKATSLVLLVAVFCSFSSLIPFAAAQGTAFTYQGRLNDGTNVASGSYDLTFALYDAASGGTQQSGTWTQLATVVTNGLFTVLLDFGNFFPGADRWLEIGVRTNGGSALVTLTPRQQLTATPYAIKANFATVATMLSTASNQPLNFVINSNSVLRITSEIDHNGFLTANSVGGSPANVISNGYIGGFIGGGGEGSFAPNRVGANFASVLGGVGNTASGVTSTAMGRDTTASGYAATAIGANTTASGVTATAIGNSTTASSFSSTAMGFSTFATGNFSTAMGQNTTASSDHSTAMGYYTTASGWISIAMGDQTTASGQKSTAMGDHATASGDYSTAMGVSTTASGFISTAMGGSTTASGPFSTVMGRDTTASGAYSTAMGYRAKANHDGSFVWSDSQAADFASTTNDQFLIRAAGGVGINTASPGAALQIGDTNTPNSQGMLRFASRSGTGPSSRYWDIGVPEGDQNTGGKYYSFVIDDPILGTEPEMMVRWDTGNVGVGITSPAAKLDVNGATIVRGVDGWDVNNTDGDLRVGSTTHRFKIGVAQSGGGSGDVWMRAHGGTARMFIKTPGGTTFYSNEGQTTGVSLASGGGAWTTLSDRNAKTNFARVNAEEVLAKVAALPLSTWNYKSQAQDIRHIGPMAQDFKAAFGVGESDTGITTVDADGVALAAIQGLNEKVEVRSQKSEDRIQMLESENADLRTRLEKLERLLSANHGGAK